MRRTSLCPTVLAFLLSPAALCAAPVQFAGTGNYYELILENADWATAKTSAEGMTYLGMQGHLATITSAGENAFVTQQLGVFGRAWIGGGDPGTEGEFSWQVGPEAGTKFWTGGLGGTPVGYANFPAGSEPNNLGGNEEFVEVFYYSGNWNDQEGTDRIPYIVEYAAVPEPAAGCLAGFAAVSLIITRRYR